MLIESQVKCRSPQNLPGDSQLLCYRILQNNWSRWRLGYKATETKHKMTPYRSSSVIKVSENPPDPRLIWKEVIYPLNVQSSSYTHLWRGGGVTNAFILAAPGKVSGVNNFFFFFVNLGSSRDLDYARGAEQKHLMLFLGYFFKEMFRLNPHLCKLLRRMQQTCRQQSEQT